MGASEWDYHVRKLGLAERIAEVRLKQLDVGRTSESEYFKEVASVLRQARRIVEDAFPKPE